MPFTCSKCKRPPKIDRINGVPPTARDVGWKVDGDTVTCPTCAGLAGKTCAIPYPVPEKTADIVGHLLQCLDHFVEVVERDYWLDGELRTAAENARSLSAVAREIVAGKRKPCFYCGRWTRMLAYVTDSSNGEEVVYPACCKLDRCIAKWEPIPVEQCPPDVLADAASRPKVANPYQKTP